MTPKKGARRPQDAPNIVPQLKEFTMTMGKSDVYVNLDRRVEFEEGVVLYEALLSDDSGSRFIYVDQDDLAACLAGSPILRARVHLEDPKESPAGAGTPGVQGKPREASEQPG